MLSDDGDVWLRLFAKAAPLTRRDYNRLRKQWRILRDERSFLRTIVEKRLVSVPDTYFDDLILSCATSDWAKSALIVGHALANSWEGDFSRVGDLILFSRVHALVRAGKLVAQGDLSLMRTSELRLPNAAQPTALRRNAKAPRRQGRKAT